MATGIKVMTVVVTITMTMLMTTVTTIGMTFQVVTPILAVTVRMVMIIAMIFPPTLSRARAVYLHEKVTELLPRKPLRELNSRKGGFLSLGALNR